MSGEPALLPIKTINELNNIIKEKKIIKEKTYKLSLNKELNKDEYQLNMSINNLDQITFYATLNNKVTLNYYESTYDLKEIIERSKVVDKKDIREIFDFYDKTLFQINEITLKLSKQKDCMYLIFNTIVNNGEKKECKIELRRNKFDNDIILEKVIRENENIKGKENIIKKQLDSYKEQVLKLQKNTEEQKSEFQKKFEEYISVLQNKFEQQILILQKNNEEQKSELQKKFEEQISELQNKFEEQISKLKNEVEVQKECNELNEKIINNYEQTINEMKNENTQTIKLLEEKIKKLEEKLEKEINNNKMIIPINQEKRNEKEVINQNKNINKNQVNYMLDILYDEEDNKNEDLEEQKENIFKNRTFNKIKYNTHKIIEEEPPKQYSYEIISEDVEKDLNIEADIPLIKSINLKLKIRNTGLDWPFNTKLMNDKDSDIKSDNISLSSLKTGGSKTISIILNLHKIKPGIKKCIFRLNVKGENYDKPLTLKVNVKEHEKIVKLRELFGLSIEDYDSDKLLDALKKSNFNLEKTFESLFN